MKQRSGFVSNSSSSSFVCYDKTVDVATAEKFMTELVKLSEMLSKVTNDEYLKFTKDAYYIKVMDTETERSLVEDWDYGNAAGNIGHTMICSTDDNSIPYPYFQLIESGLQMTRFHLG